MPKLTAKRQVTIPQNICHKLGLEPGDFIQIFERDGVAHLVKMTADDLEGTLSFPKDSDKESNKRVDIVQESRFDPDFPTKQVIIKRVTEAFK